MMKRACIAVFAAITLLFPSVALGEELIADVASQEPEAIVSIDQESGEEPETPAFETDTDESDNEQPAADDPIDVSGDDTGITAGDVTGDEADQDLEDPAPVLATGWLEDGGVRSYRDSETGELYADGFFDIDGETYCFDPDGALVTGWIAVDGDVYYFDVQSGAMLKDCDQLIAGLCAPTAAADGATFSDVTDSTAHAEDIQWNLESGISAGWVSSNGTRTFRPLAAVVRQDMAAFLYRLAGSPEFIPTEEDAAAFTDVTAATPHALEIWWLAKEHISEGWHAADGTSTFRPMANVARQDMAAFLYRLAGSPDFDPNEDAEITFTDVTPETAHATEILWLAQTGISEGWVEQDGTRTFRPSASIARMDTAAFLHRMVTMGELEPSAPHSYRFDEDGKLVTGWSDDGSFHDPTTGALVEEGWVRDGSFLGYLDPQAGGLLKDGFHEIAGYFYLFDTTGNAQRGWIASGNKHLYFDASSGCQLRGGSFAVAGARYLFDEDGALLYGWNDFRGNSYYSDTKSGKLYVSGMYFLNRTVYFADAQGRLTISTFGQLLADASAKQKQIAALAWAEPTTPSGWCALWIHNIFDHLGDNPVYGNACDLYNNYCTSSNPADLKVGMIVAVSRHPGTAGGRIYGHIGIYVGNGLMLDSSGKVRTWYVGDWVDSYNGWVPAKWGWYGGKSLA